MPANRSRTLHWRRCLEQIQERKGAIDIAVAGGAGADTSGWHLVWRVRLLAVSVDEIVVEQPTTLGRLIGIRPGVELVAVMTVGQNRWTFRTTNLGPSEQACGRRTIPALRLTMPERVDRCQRRNHYRVRTSGLSFPQVELWPLLDPKSVVLAERANELACERQLTGHDADRADPVMPEVGPCFTALLVNCGGGGVGLYVPPEYDQAVSRHRLFWMRLKLEPELVTPICATAKLVHTHMQSDQHVYAGMAFDFSFNPGHQRFVVEQICRYVALQQKAQLDDRAAA